MGAQDTAESSTTLQVATVKGVDLSFTSQDLAMSINDFSAQFISPAMSVLAANIEADALTMIKDVYNSSNNTAAAITMANVLGGRKKLQDNLAPMENRTCLLSTNDNALLVSALNGQYNDQKSISKQYLDGYMGYAAGMDFMETSLMNNQTRGAANTAYTINGLLATGATSTAVITGSGAWVVGDTFTIAGANRCHPETKADTGVLQQFVVTAALAGTGTLSFSPALNWAPTAIQNVYAQPATTAAITLTGTLSTNYGQSLIYHKDAFTFATADLPLPKGAVDFAAREVMDGISMSICRGFNIADRTFPTRIDVLYGFKTIRPQWACRLANLAGS